MKACNNLTTLVRTPKELFSDNTFLETEENAKLLSECIKKQVSLERFDIDDVRLSDRSAHNLLKMHYMDITDLETLPSELFYNNTFLHGEENIEVLCQVIAKQTNLQRLNISHGGSMLKEQSRIKILETCCEINSLVQIQKEIFNYDNFLDSVDNVKLIHRCVEKQDKMHYLDINNVTLSDLQAFNLLENHFSLIEKLANLPSELFNNNSFLQSESNIDALCKCISKQKQLTDLIIYGEKLNGQE